jgi:hypothetical protein
MNRIAAIILTVGMTIASLPTAYGQQISTVGDVVDKGGKKLTKDEVQKLASGAIVSGFQGGNFPNTRFRNQLSPNGSVSGDAWHGDVWFTKISGTWSVNDAGQYCNDLKNDQGIKIVGCFFYYSLGDRLYSAAGTDRSVPVNVRQFAR